jgi:adenylate cyclase
MSVTEHRAIRLDGAKCVQARMRGGFSQQKLADASKGGISIATIKRLESGAPVYVDTARRLATLLGVPLRTLVEGSGDAPAGGVDTRDAGPPVIAVLPFDALDGDEPGRCFSDGLVEDLITRLGRRWFPVISRGSTFLYRDDRPAPARIGGDLGADYLIEGSVRRSSGTVRVTARLVDARTSRQVWASQYDRPYADVFAVQDGLVSTIVGQADAALVEREAQAQAYRNPNDLDAWELSLRGSWYFHRRSKEHNGKARALFEEALRRDVMLPLGWYFLAMTHQRAIINQWSADLGQTLREMNGVCEEFARHHPNDPGLHVATAYAAVYAGDRRSAQVRLREAIDLDPNAAPAYSLYGQTLAMTKEVDEAIEQFELALRLSPCDAEVWSVQTAMALCHFVADRYDEMLRWSQRAVRSRPDMPFPYGAVAAAKAALGDAEGATAAVREMLELEPTMCVRGLARVLGAIHPEIAARYLEALRRAGVPD